MRLRRAVVKWWRSAGLALAFLPCLSLAQPVQENDLKAAFVYNFVQFTDWPPGAVGSSPTLNICLNAGSELQQAFQSLNGRIAKGQKIKVFTSKALDKQAADCHVIYVESLDRPRWPAIKRALARGNTLTISDDPQLAQSGVMIMLSVQHSKMVFDVDAGEARQARLTLSSKLLRLARTVK